MSTRDTDAHKALGLSSVVALDSPIRILSEDLLRLVFQAAYEADHPEVWRQSHRTLVSICISRVCSTWRRIALDFALLWQVIWASPSTSDQLGTLLPRSKEASITLHILFTGEGTGRGQLISVLKPHLWRCRGLYVGGRHYCVASFMCAIAGRVGSANPPNAPPANNNQRITAPRLESLHISTSDGDIVGALNADHDLFSGIAPRLREVRFRGISGLFLQHSLASITTLDVDALSPAIELCNSLVRLSFRGNKTLTKPLPLPQLRFLRWLINSTPSNSQMLLSPESWAGLTDLQLQIRWSNSLITIPIFSLTNNLRRAFISILCEQHDAQELPEKAHLPNLTELVVRLQTRRWMNVPPSLLDCLTTPRLRCLSLVHDVGTYRSGPFGTQLWRFLRHSRPPLKRLYMRGEYNSPLAMGEDHNICTAVEADLPWLRFLYISHCNLETRHRLTETLVTRGGSFCEREANVMDGVDDN